MIKVDHFNMLLVDDEALLRQSLSRKISEADSNYHITAECSDGKSALEALNDNNIQVVFTDIRMPEMDGLELAKEIRERYPEIITVILTGYADFEYAREAIRQGIFDYILKPVDDEDLERILAKITLELQKMYELPEEEGLSGSNAQSVASYVEKYIANHFAEEIDFGKLAEEMGYTSAYISKVFTRFYEEPPMRYLTELRMNEAKKLLSITNEPIARVGEMVGYPDQFYFSRTFRKEVGENPTAFRRTHS